MRCLLVRRYATCRSLWKSMDRDMPNTASSTENQARLLAEEASSGVVRLIERRSTASTPRVCNRQVSGVDQ